MTRYGALLAAMALIVGLALPGGVQAAPFQVSSDWVDFFVPLSPDTSGGYPATGTESEHFVIGGTNTPSSGFLDMSLDFPGMPTDITNATLYVDFRGMNLAGDLVYSTCCPTKEQRIEFGIPDSDPANLTATFNGDTVTTTSCKDLSNVVLKFADGTEQKWDNLTDTSGTFYGTGDNAGKEIVGVWVKSGENESGDGPGYGEYIENDGTGFVSNSAASVSETVTITDSQGATLGTLDSASGYNGDFSIAIPLVPDEHASLDPGYSVNLQFASLVELVKGSIVCLNSTLHEVRVSIQGETGGGVTPIPEPAAVALILGGAGLLAASRRKKNRRNRKS